MYWVLLHNLLTISFARELHANSAFWDGSLGKLCTWWALCNAWLRETLCFVRAKDMVMFLAQQAKAAKLASAADPTHAGHEVVAGALKGRG